MRKPSSSSKHVIAALVAATFGLSTGGALAQTAPRSDQGNTAASHRHASRKSARKLSSQENEHMRATTGTHNRTTAQLNQRTRHMKAAQSKEMRVASAQHYVRKSERHQRSHVHPRNTHPANATPPPR
jgi:hypothetical protein